MGNRFRILFVFATICLVLLVFFNALFLRDSRIAAVNRQLSAHRTEDSAPQQLTEKSEGDSAATMRTAVPLEAALNQGFLAMREPVPEQSTEAASILNPGLLQMKYELNELMKMDKAIKDYLFSEFSGQNTLPAIIAKTEGTLHWSQWPKGVIGSDAYMVSGVCDEAMSDESWSQAANRVWVIYASYYGARGVEVHFFQNSFRAIDKSYVRECPSMYAILKESDGSIHINDLYYPRMLVIAGGAGSLESIPRLLDFLPIASAIVPGIVVVEGYGPITYYKWNEDYGLWEGVQMELDEDSKLRTLDLFSLYSKQKDSLNSELEVTRGNSSLMPPGEFYERP